jgi:hypothetical protein
MKHVEIFLRWQNRAETKGLRQTRADLKLNPYLYEKLTFDNFMKV